MQKNNEKNKYSGEKYRRASPVLSSRLLCGANMLRAGQPMADIGCDHGKLAVWLAFNLNTPKVVAVDNRPLPLERAKALVSQTNCGNIVSCRLGNGLQPLEENEASDIVIAGISGETIIEILEPIEWVKNINTNMVFIPTGRDSLLRKFLCENGFEIIKEKAVLDGGYIYSVINARYSGNAYTPDAIYLLLGNLHGTTEEEQLYIEKKLRDLKNRLLGITEPAKRRETEKLIAEAEKCLQQNK